MVCGGKNRRQEYLPADYFRVSVAARERNYITSATATEFLNESFCSFHTRDYHIGNHFGPMERKAVRDME